MKIGGWKKRLERWHEEEIKLYIIEKVACRMILVLSTWIEFLYIYCNTFGCAFMKKTRRNLCWSWHFDIHKKFCCSINSLWNLIPFLLFFSSSSIQLYSSISRLPFMNAKLVESWESSEKENWVAIWEIYLLATEHYSIDQFISGWLDGQEAIIGYLWDYYVI